jgi:HrpA-like RNA helicase
MSPTGLNTKVMVAEPRRLACQTAARRVAMEQGYTVGSKQSPIGYAIRFESFLSDPDCCRSIDFCTTGVLLRRAMDDPLLSDLSHLIVDEVHERNADTDLLLSLARQTIRKRAKHETLPPLRLILMSATLDCHQWESYFKVDDPSTLVAVVDVPGIRRFPVKTFHLGEDDFPLEHKLTRQILDQRRNGECEDILCTATAQLATELYFRSASLGGDGSILCFLPGMDEIRSVHQQINRLSRRHEIPNVIYLHSSVHSADQAKAFQAGKKIILVRFRSHYSTGKCFLLYTFSPCIDVQFRLPI